MQTGTSSSRVLSCKALKRIDELSSFVQDIKLVYSTADRPKLKSPHLICGFPGSGYVGKLAVDHLIQELPANHLVHIYPSSSPPQIMIKPDGTADLMKNSIFWWQGEGSDLLLLTGDSQPANPDSEYALAEEVLGLAEGFGTQQVFTLAAYITGVFVDKPKIFGTATDPETVKILSSNNISIMDNGSITGMNGLVIGIAKLHKRAKDTEMLIQTIEQQMLAARGGRQLEGQQPPQKPRDTGYIS